jgi:hypothetical protein
LQEVIKNEGADEGLGDVTELLYKIADIVGEKAVKEYEQKSQQGYVPLTSIPQLLKSMAFSNVQLKWSQEKKAFYNEGKIGVSHILKNDINAAFEGFMEIRRNEDGSSVFHVFFKASPEVWYYFGFEDNRLLVQSSNGIFNDIINKKTDAKKAKLGEIAFMPGSEEETLAFINRFRKTYYGIDFPYQLHDAPAPLDHESSTPAIPAVVPTETPKTETPKTEPARDEPQDQELPQEVKEEKKEPKQKQPKQKKSKDKNVPVEEESVPGDQTPKEKPKEDKPKEDEDDGF